MSLCLIAITLVLILDSAAAADWRLALPGYQYQFPRDHRAHPEYKTEWWYLTGNLVDGSGREFGYQLTFFRQGLRPPGSQPPTSSRFLRHEFYFAHFAVSDIRAKRFHHTQEITRGAFDEAGVSDTRLVWIRDWELIQTGPDSFQIAAKAKDYALQLRVEATKPLVIHGAGGVSQKAAGEGRASHYYSFTRMKSGGEIAIGRERFAVTGESWFDREWATNQLEANQAGWDWFSIQLENGEELMVYQMRLKGTGRDPNSSGTFIGADGKTQHLHAHEYVLKPLRSWTSPGSKASYPVEWNLQIPKLGLDLKVNAAMDPQELSLPPVIYWEGAVRATGRRDGKSVQGKGYLEMTGYAAPLQALQR